MGHYTGKKHETRMSMALSAFHSKQFLALISHVVDAIIVYGHIEIEVSYKRLLMMLFPWQPI
jgi:hypothetical protein